MKVLFSKHSTNDENDIPSNVVEAHEHSHDHKDEILESNQLGCFACLEMFKPIDVKKWIRDSFCLCPNCEMDAVIGDRSGIKITKKFLVMMNHYWFNDVIWEKPVKDES